MTTLSSATSPGVRQCLPIYPSQFICAILMASLGPLLDPMMRGLSVPVSRGGLISGVFFIGGVAGIAVANTAMAQVPIKWGLIGSMAVQGICVMLAATTAHLWSLLPFFFVAGFGGVLVAVNSWVWIAAHVKEQVAAAALFMLVFFAAGMIVTPLAVGPVLDAGVSWRWVLAVEGGISLAAGLVFIPLPLLDVPGRHNVRLTHLRQVVGHNRGLLSAMLASGFLYTGAETMFNVWLPKFEIDVFAASDTRASLSVTLFWCGLIAGRLVMMPLSKRFLPSRLLLICGAVMAVMAVALAVAPNEPASLVLAIVAGLGASGSYAIIGSYAGRFPGWQSGVASSLFILCGSVGCALFPYLFGPLAGAAGFRVALGATAVPALAYGLLSLLVHTRSGE